MQLLQSEMLPFEKTETAANGDRIRCGIEFDAIGRRVAYHFRRRHPGDSTDQGAVIPETVRVPAEDVLHVYRPIDAAKAAAIVESDLRSALTDARARSRKLKLALRVRYGDGPAGTVLEQSLEPGIAIRPGLPLTLLVGRDSAS